MSVSGGGGSVLVARGGSLSVEATGGGDAAMVAVFAVLDRDMARNSREPRNTGSQQVRLTRAWGSESAPRKKTKHVNYSEPSKKDLISADRELHQWCGSEQIPSKRFISRDGYPYQDCASSP